MHSFQLGQSYNRQKDIHDIYGGSRQSGISASAGHPYIFLFTGSNGSQYGYDDGWKELDKIFRYTGEGKKGDMTFTKGNKAIMEHVQKGKALLLFEYSKKGSPYQFLGEFTCASFEEETLPDEDGKLRKAIIFDLVAEQGETIIVSPITKLPVRTLEELRNNAYNSVKPGLAPAPKEGLRKYYERNQAIKDYVIERSGGKCECCGVEAPFLKKDGTPYLEPHHIRKVADDGLDHPEWVAALSPNCHRRIHHGEDGYSINAALREVVLEKEKTWDLLRKL